MDFLNKVKDGVSKGAAVVGASSKALMEKTQINAKIKTLETERDQLAATLGMQVYENLTKNNEVVVDETMHNLTSEITTRITLIAEQKAEIERIDQEVNLVKGERAIPTEGGKVCVCGQGLSFDAKFCAKCGIPQPEQTEQPEQPEPQPEPTPEEPKVDNICACGHTLADGVKFCGKCGKPQ